MQVDCGCKIGLAVDDRQKNRCRNKRRGRGPLPPWPSRRPWGCDAQPPPDQPRSRNGRRAADVVSRTVGRRIREFLAAGSRNFGKCELRWAGRARRSKWGATVANRQELAVPPRNLPRRAGGQNVRRARWSMSGARNDQIAARGIRSNLEARQRHAEASSRGRLPRQTR